MGNDEPRYFFDTYLVPNYENWKSAPQDIRLAMNAAVSANQLADWCVIYWNKKGDAAKVNNCTPSRVGAYRDSLATNECRDFSIIRDVAECHKHLEIDRTARKISSAYQTAHGSLGWGQGGYGEGVYGGGPQLVIHFDDGTKRAFSAPLKNVFEMWCRLLNGWGCN